MTNDGKRFIEDLERERQARREGKHLTCKHLNFKADVRVACMYQKEGDPVTGWQAEMTIVCTDCGLPFRFVGLKGGNHYAEPRVSADGLELRAPIEPASHEKFVNSLDYVFPPSRRQMS